MTTSAELLARIAELEQSQATAQLLFEMSRGLNIATDEGSLLQTIAYPAFKAGATKAVLYYLEMDNRAEPTWAEVVASIDHSNTIKPDYPVGARFYLPEFRFAKFFVTKPYEPLLMEDVDRAEWLDETEREILRETGTMAWVVIPLTQTERWVGNIQFSWCEPHHFNSHEQEIYQAIMGLAAPAIENRRLVTHLERMVAERTDKLRAEITERKKTEEQLAAYRDHLEDLVEARTHQLGMVAMLSGRFNAILEVETLLLELVNQVQQKFGYYHTQVYIVDELKQQLVMQAGVGEVGLKLKAQGHAISLHAPTSLVARAALEQRVIMVADVLNDATWLPQPLLPETRSEMAVPIMREEQVLGVLDVQSSELNGLDEGDANLLQSLANQVAIALTNAQLFAQAEQQQAKLRQEIAHREQAEQDLLTFKTLVENAPDGIYVTTLAGNVTYANPAFCKLMGYERAIKGMNVTEFLPDDVLTQFGSARQTILDGAAWQGYLPHRNAQGQLIPVQSSAFMIWDEHGQPTALASINHDITERQQAEQALLASEKKFYSLYVSMNEALALYELVYNEQGRPIDYVFLDINPTFTTMTGLKWEDVVGQRASEVHKLERLPYLGTYNWVAESGETTSFEARLDQLIGGLVEATPKIIRVAAFSPTRGQFATILQDITQRKQIEQRMANYNRILEEEVAERTRKLTQTLENLKSTQSQLVESEKMAALGSLVAGVAHEINTPVGIGVSMASFLAHETSKIEEMVKSGKMKISALKEYLQTASESSTLILNNLNRAAELVQSFKQVAVDQTSLDRRKFQIKPYIEETLLNLRHVLKRTEHVIEVFGDNHLTLNSYPGAFSQVVSNLVMNSLKHAYEEGDNGLMRFEIKPHDDWVTLTYQDDGIGIPPENLGRIFEPFFTTARSRGGSGLGLHIVYNLITQTLQGTIHCESTIGQGTKFIIELPLAVSITTKTAV